MMDIKKKKLNIFERKQIKKTENVKITLDNIFKNERKPMSFA